MGEIKQKRIVLNNVKVRELIEKHKIVSQAHLSRLTGISDKTLEYWMNSDDRKNLSVRVVYNLSKLFNVPMEELIIEI